MTQQIRWGLTFESPAELQAAVQPRLEAGDLFVPYPDEVADGAEAAVDVMLVGGARIELLGLVKGPDFDDRGNVGVVLTLAPESAATLRQFLADVLAGDESAPLGRFTTVRLSRPKTVRMVDNKAGSYPDGEDDVLLEPGTMLEERFRIEAHVASGGMGQVYRAAHVHLKRPVALKLLKRSLAADPAMWARFQREAELVSQLESPYVVRVFDFGRTAAGQPFLAMEYVEGTPLDAVLANGPLEPGRVVDILRQICEGLGDAHALGIIHRDLKPPNIVLGRKRDGSELAKILDFGIARSADKPSENESKLTQVGMVLGTPMYLAPEQALAGALDERTDIYALGCMAFELLTGRVPFLAPELATIISMHLTQPPPDPASFRPELEAWKPLTDVVLKALSKSKADRQSSVAELSKALDEALLQSRAKAPSGAWFWPPASPSAPVPARAAAAPAPAPSGATPAPGDFLVGKGPPAASQQAAGLSAPAALRRSFEALKVPLSATAVYDLVTAREAFVVTGNRLLLAHLEVLGAPARSPRALRCIARAIMVAHTWDGIIDAADDDRLVVLFSGEALSATARATLALLAIREAVADEAARGADPGPGTVRAAVIQVSTRTELASQVEERVVKKAQLLAARQPVGTVLLERQLASDIADVVDSRPIDQTETVEVTGRRSRLGAPSPALIGRDGVLQLLDKRLASLAAGMVAPFVVRGPRGAGRTSLVTELASRARAKGHVVGVAQNPEALRGIAFGAVTELMCAVLGVNTASRAQTLRAALEKLSLHESAVMAALVIAGVVQLPQPFTAGQAAQAVRVVLKAGAAGRTVLLLFDGLETFDALSVETFRELVTRAAPKELTIGFVDPEVSLERLGSVPSVDLNGLTRADIAQWLTVSLALPPAASLVETFVTRTAGVPGRMVDLLAFLHDGGLLRQQGGQSVLLGEVPAMDGDALTRARFAVTPLDVIRLLEAAALNGDSFEGVQVSTALPRVTPQALQIAVKSRLLRGLPNRRWAFTSSRVQRLLVEMPSPERVTMHQRLAAAMVEQARSSPASIDPLMLAAHLNAAREGVRAAALWKHAAETALAERRPRDAISAIRGWVEALGQAPQMTAELQRGRVDALARAAGIALSMQDAATARVLVDEAMALQQRQDLGSPELALSLARVHRSEARRARATETLTLAQQRAGNTPFLALVEAERAEAREQEGDLPGAVMAWEQSLQSAPAAEELARWHGEVNLTARVEARLAGVKLMRKEVASARTLLESSLRRWQATNWATAEARVLANLGTLNVHANLLGEAATRFDAAEVASAASGDLLFRAKMMLQHARVLKRQNQAAPARKLALQARQLSIDLGWEEGRVQAEAV